MDDGIILFIIVISRLRNHQYLGYKQSIKVLEFAKTSTLKTRREQELSNVVVTEQHMNKSRELITKTSIMLGLGTINDDVDDGCDDDDVDDGCDDDNVG